MADRKRNPGSSIASHRDLVEGRCTVEEYLNRVKADVDGARKAREAVARKRRRGRPIAFTWPRWLRKEKPRV